MTKRYAALAGGLLLVLPILLWAAAGQSQEWRRSDRGYPQSNDAYPTESDEREPAQPPSRYDPPPAKNSYGRPTYGSNPPPNDPYSPHGTARAPANDAYSPRAAGRAPADDAYSPPPHSPPGYAQQDQPQDRAYRPPRNDGYGPPPGAAPGRPYGEPYGPPPDQAYNERDPRYGPPNGYDGRYPPREEHADGSYSSREIMDAGHGFFGSVSKGLASVVEYAFRKQGRPNGYILGQEAGGALVAGLRYGEGTLYTKDAGTHRVYWQGPSIGWDLGGEGSKVMMLVYNLHDPDEIYQRFGGVDGSAYFVGGVGVTFQAKDDVIIAPIRAGVGLRLGANVGYLKYTRRPTWNPF